ncbi:LodA/GoxA family CTQ-dependent oxidase [Pseudoalteromonas sp. DL2-H2.2]|uniref:LodA/GoxA family CTQ-dependent oxidase n=1 Tax=Pseudoalteromonas sp. DL2-H2.2 TaxID=2908889 RepID=UPI001F2BAFD0|nr:LodA/GoxA family CTQ-dependent oxidase [Pseudoalteromonas sp. DL2-H2.2]MCF2910609.1 LodA/GoxA family CTQ-dependent oxidase [Pseudoalteromonas sp. DL2-H2.2]
MSDKKKRNKQQQGELVNPKYLKKNIDNAPTANEVKCWTGDDYQPIELATQRLKEMFVEMGQKTRIERGQKPAERAVFRKQHGIAYGTFEIHKNLDKCLQAGVFAKPASYECVLRFSSDTTPDGPDLHSTLGVGIKLFGVKGKKLLGDSDNVDFIMQNIDRFFVRDASQMCAFTTAGIINRDYPAYLAKHPKTANVLDDMAKPEASCLSAHYWAILPFKLGEKAAVKYRIRPVDTYRGSPAQGNDYLADDLQIRLRQGPAKFVFEIQRRPQGGSEKDFPIDNAMVVWPEDEAPFEPVATLTLPQQDICAIGQAEFGRNLAFNIWRTLAENEPLGSIAQARKIVYQASANTRHQANGQQMNEPDAIDPKFTGNSDESSDCIVRAGIYPPIGVMRVGSSQEYFIGPQVPNPKPRLEKDAYRDGKGLLKRQAAEFRIYGFNAAGKPVKELTMDNAKISWQVHLANQKSSWYEFQLALDVPEAADAPPSLLRNNNVADRNRLLIDGGSHKLDKAKVKKGPQFQGEFMGEEVYLGELKSDKQGRLIVLGGNGVSRNINGDIAITFANNQGWHDDISDGPVTAEVEYEGVQLQVDPAWVVCAPPDYAPMQKSVRTMWDLMRSVAVNAGMLTRPARPSFKHDILPIFERMTDLQWVNAGFAAGFGFKAPFNYTSEEWKAKLGNPSPAYKELRRTLSNNFRRYGQPGAQAAQLWPWLYGDALSIPPTGSERQHSTLSALQLSFLDQWVEGDFTADYVDPAVCPHAAEPNDIDKVPVAEQPDMLTRGALDFCLADAFHPGCEMTWPMRTAGMYMAPFRIKHADKGISKDTTYYGAQINGDTITLAQGPILGGQVAGGITRWMAIPWQTDTASCRDGYTPDYDPYLPTFWPARVPNNILNVARYEEAINPALDPQTRVEAFNYRSDWLDALPLYGQPATYTAQINSMIANFDKLAVVQSRPGATDSVELPATMQVGITAEDHLSKEASKAAAKAQANNKLLTVAQLAANLVPSPDGQDAARPVMATSRSRVDLGVIEKVSRFAANFPKDLK